MHLSSTCTMSWSVWFYVSKKIVCSFCGFLEPVKPIRIYLTLTFLCIKAYRDHIASGSEEDASKLDGTITFLKHTSSMIELFSDCKHECYSEGDVRLQALLATLHFFKECSAQVTSANQFISAKLWFDLQSMILGFISVVQTKLRRFPGSTIKPAIINQDTVENHFSQIRAANGQNDNPTYLATQGTQNSIIFGQTTVSRNNKGAFFCWSSQEKSFWIKRKVTTAQEQDNIVEVNTCNIYINLTV